MRHITEGVTVYDGRTLLGFVIDGCDGTEAVLPAGKSLGKFNDQVAAARALFVEARKAGVG